MSINIKGKTNIGPMPEEPAIYHGGFFSYYKPVTSRFVSVLDSGGTADNTFNLGSSFWHPTIDLWVNKVSLQSDNKILVGGRLYYYNTTTTNSLARLNIDGSLDTTLVTGSGFNSDVLTIETQTDSNILVGGFFTSYNGTAKNRIVRITSGGTIDGTFNIGTGFNQGIYSIKQQTDNKIIVGGSFTSYSGVSVNGIIRLNSDGSIDNTFSSGTGFVSGTIYDTLTQPDGKILVGGFFTSYSGVSVNRIVRLNSDGSIDNTFNIGTGFNSEVKVIILQSDGKILVGGNFQIYNGTNISRVVRLNSDGSIDNTFSTGAGFNDVVNTITLQSDGKILVGGNFTSYDGASKNRILRLNTDGSIDNTFSIGKGFVRQVASIVITPNSNIVVGNYSEFYNQTKNAFNILKTDVYGTIDNNFDTGTGFNGIVQSIYRQNDKKLLVGGSFTSYNDVSHNYFVRLNSNGLIDNTFNVPIEINGTVNNIKQQTDNKIVSVGYFTKYISRLNTDGSIDNTFNIGTGFNNIASSFEIQPDGKIIVVGFFTSYSGVSVNRIIRLNSDGSIDNTFNIGTGFNNVVQVMGLQSDGKIIVGGGFTSYSGVSKNRIIRLNSDGSIDNTFNIGTGFNGVVGSMKILGNGKILVGGVYTSYNGTAKLFMVRLNTDGSLDSSFPSVDVGVGVNTGLYPRVIKEDLQNRILVGGNFQSFNGTRTNRVVRLTSGGLVDTSFNIGTGFFVDGGTCLVNDLLLVKT